MRDYTLWAWGENIHRYDNTVVTKSSPVQIPGTTWTSVSLFNAGGFLAIKEG